MKLNRRQQICLVLISLPILPIALGISLVKISLLTIALVADWLYMQLERLNLFLGTYYGKFLKAIAKVL